MKEATPMIPTQHAPGNTTPTAPAPAPIGAGVSVAALYTATAAQPYHSHSAGNGRLVDAFYLLPGQAQRGAGDYLDAAELSIWHHKDAKCYRATLSATSIRLHGGMFRAAVLTVRHPHHHPGTEHPSGQVPRRRVRPVHHRRARPGRRPPRRRRRPVMTAPTIPPVPVAEGEGSAFTRLHEVPRFDLYCRADAITGRALVEVPGLLASAFRLPWPVAVTAQAWDDVIGWPTEGAPT